MARLSAVRITLNEERNIGRALESVRWADEIIVLDSGSVDATVSIARDFGARVETHEWRGYVNAKYEAAELANCLATEHLHVIAAQTSFDDQLLAAQ